MKIEKRQKDAIEGMALYIEECMAEVRKQMISEPIPDMDIAKRRIARAAGTLDVLTKVVEDLSK